MKILIMSDSEIIQAQPQFKLTGLDLEQWREIKSYKGKFVLSKNHQIFIRLIPLKEWEKSPFFHDQIVKELGVSHPQSSEVQQLIIGGGKVALDIFEDHLELLFYGKSTIYGAFQATHFPSHLVEDHFADHFGQSVLLRIQ